MIRKAHILVVVVLVAAACGTDPDPTSPLALSFGPFELQPSQERTDLCVSTTLHNDQPIYVNSVEMTTATGVHHSNWFWVPEHQFDGPDGAWTCGDRGFDTAAAALFGGVLFAQSTQATHEVQAFPAGAAIKIAPHARIVGNIHMLNATDMKLSIPLALTVQPIAAADATTVLAGFAVENESIAIPPLNTSRFTVECDLSQTWQNLYQLEEVSSDHIDFKIYHALPHYHALGTAMTFEAIRDSDGGSDMIWSTDQRIGDKLGGTLDPPFDLTGHSKIRMSCTFENPRTVSVGWGNGDQEMCIMFAFSSSTYTWNAGVLSASDPGPSVTNNGIIDFTAPACNVITADAQH
jgi:hypothetical protein